MNEPGMPGTHPYALIANRDHPNDGPTGWIQWKNTDACVDLHCVCGTLGHFDGYHMYKVECQDCGRKYVVGQNIKLIELDTPELLDAGIQWAGNQDKWHPFNDAD
jgi:hypothetical protein